MDRPGYVRLPPVSADRTHAYRGTKGSQHQEGIYRTPYPFLCEYPTSVAVSTLAEECSTTKCEKESTYGN